MVSHDRYFLERVTDSIWALLDDGQISMLPGGVDDYLARRSGTSPAPRGELSAESGGQVPPRPGTAPASARARAGSAEERAARKTMARLEKRMEQISAQEEQLNAEVVAHAADHTRLTELSRSLGELAEEKAALEEEWLEAAAAVE